jgi:hypothetical protein
MLKQKWLRFYYNIDNLFKRCDMKKYISAILIPCLLLQLCGCYTFQNISTEELYNRKDREDITIIDFNDYEYFFKAKNYIISNDSIDGKSMRNKINNEAEKEVFKGKIALTDIKSIQEDRINYLTTTLLIVCMLGIIVGLASIESFDMSGWANDKW